MDLVLKEQVCSRLLTSSIVLGLPAWAIMLILSRLADTPVDENTLPNHLSLFLKMLDFFILSVRCHAK